MYYLVTNVVNATKEKHLHLFFFWIMSHRISHNFYKSLLSNGDDVYHFLGSDFNRYAFNM